MYLLVATVSGCGGKSYVDRSEGALVIALDQEAMPELAGMLAAHAHENGFYFRDSSHYLRRNTNGAITVHMTIFRQMSDGAEWDEIKAIASGDQPIVTFQVPTDASVRQAAYVSFADLKRKLVAKWPDSGDAPILPSGSIPHARDLTLIESRYRIRADKAADYELSIADRWVAPKPTQGKDGNPL